MRPFLVRRRGCAGAALLFGGIAGAGACSAASLAVVQLVVLKMLPFDNKSELQVVVDLPEGTHAGGHQCAAGRAGARWSTRVPEVLDYQGYAGTSAPMNFNGLVRQYFLRSGSNVGDLQVNLVDKHERDRQSHEIARALRPQLAAVGKRHGASVKVVEVPPGPPVLSPLVAEVYGPDYARSAQARARAARSDSQQTEGIVDIDTSVESDAPRETLRGRSRPRRAPGRAAVGDRRCAGRRACPALDATYLHDGASKLCRVPVRLRLPAAEQADDRAAAGAARARRARASWCRCRSWSTVQRAPWDGAIHAQGSAAGGLRDRRRGRRARQPAVRHVRRWSGSCDDDTGGRPAASQQTFIAQPADTSGFAVKWDGEWQITYETFRDMGIAYAAGMVLIYLLVVAQFRSYLVPLVIMAPIPLTVIGVMPGHALLGAQFTATSMIGMIALAGIIVRNSILLVDFINQSMRRGPQSPKTR